MTLRFELEWLDDVPTGMAYGPELDTWCRLAISLNGEIITANHSADFHSSTDRNHVIGPTSGLVEWIVEVWPYLLWEVHCPFAKTPSLGSRVRIPTERDAAALWVDLATTRSLREVAVWQHRHTFGHGAADLALPSIVFLPEDKRLGIVVDHIPPRLDPTVRFTPPGNAQWPSDPVWIAREDAVAEFSRLVEETLARVRSRLNHAWATFVEGRWEAAKSAAADPQRRRELSLGKVVADRWSTIVATLNGDSLGLEALLFDSEVLTAATELQQILDFALTAPVKPGKSTFRATPKVGRPYEQGYALARDVRAFIQNESDPIVSLNETLDSFCVQLKHVSTSAFASSCFARERGGAVIALSDQRSKWGVAPSRFAIAAALGRLLGERVEGRPFGAAHSGQSRWIATQRANAFAAELLLPAQAFAGGSDLSDLCDAYGISRSAAEWHLHNRRLSPPS
ncbi:MAG TPA: hypothetical protein VK932_08665 [Kofleriaceae bacterium]|nr:hypothetical protein [Kofleriaceae bacterium]